jgi:RimJ/RimL family protein N-acetyltransferase
VTPSFGHRLCRAVGGWGYATEGARALLPPGIHGAGRARVFAVTYEKNRASRRMVEKLGMMLARR